jgi:transcription antitermination factor NusB
MGKRHKARELAVQVLFHMEFSPGDPDDVFDLICEHFTPSETIRAFSKKLVCGVCQNKEYLDSLIRRSSVNWRLERMARVDRCILRLGVFEIVFLRDIPPKVSIDESVELGKTFGTEDSGSFINGILDNIYNILKQESALSK